MLVVEVRASKKKKVGERDPNCVVWRRRGRHDGGRSEDLWRHAARSESSFVRFSSQHQLLATFSPHPLLMLCLYNLTNLKGRTERKEGIVYKLAIHLINLLLYLLLLVAFFWRGWSWIGARQNGGCCCSLISSHQAFSLSLPL